MLAGPQYHLLFIQVTLKSNAPYRSALATCVFSYKFLMLVNIVHSEVNIKEADERNTNLTQIFKPSADSNQCFKSLKVMKGMFAHFLKCYS